MSKAQSPPEQENATEADLDRLSRQKVDAIVGDLMRSTVNKDIPYEARLVFMKMAQDLLFVESYYGAEGLAEYARILDETDLTDLVAIKCKPLQEDEN